MRIVSNYKPAGEQELPKKSGSKSFITKESLRKIRKQERQNRKVSR